MLIRRMPFVLLLCLTLSIPMFAQSSTGAISGIITDESGGALPGVSVTATNAATGASRVAVTNASGAYRVALLTPGTYSVDVALEGFQPIRRGNVVVNIGSDVSLNVTMKVGVAETVTVRKN